MGAGNWSAHDQTLRLSWVKLLDYFFTPKNRVLCGLGNTKFDDGLGWNLDLLLRLRAFLFCFHQLAKTGQDKFAVLFNLFVGERAERIQEYSSGFFVGLGGFGKCDFEVLPCHLEEGLRGGSSHENRTASTKAKIIIVAVQALATFLVQGHWRFGIECARTSLLR